MNSKTKLIELIQQLPEEKTLAAMTLIKQLLEEPESGKSAPDPLQEFMKAMVYSMNNSLYDLSIDAGRKEEKVLANRLESYRKRVSEAWEIYNNSRN